MSTGKITLKQSSAPNSRQFRTKGEKRRWCMYREIKSRQHEVLSGSNEQKSRNKLEQMEALGSEWQLAFTLSALVPTFQKTRFAPEGKVCVSLFSHYLFFKNNITKENNNTLKRGEKRVGLGNRKKFPSISQSLGLPWMGYMAWDKCPNVSGPCAPYLQKRGTQLDSFYLPSLPDIRLHSHSIFSV